MNPYPLASLNHLTRPFAMLPYLAPFLGAAPLDTPRTGRGRLPSRKANKNAARTVSRASCLFGLAASPTSGLNPEPREKTTRSARGASTAFYRSGHWCGSVSRAKPTRNHHGEAPGGPAGDDDVDLFWRREFRDERLGCRWRAREPEIGAFAMPVVGHEVPVRTTNRFIQKTAQVVFRPAGVTEGTRVLRSDDEHGVRIKGEVFAVPDPRHRPSERAGELARGTARVVRNAVRRLAGEEGDGTGPRAPPPVDVVRRPRGPLPPLRAGERGAPRGGRTWQRTP